jgi:hypothetical protein
MGNSKFTLAICLRRNAGNRITRALAKFEPSVSGAEAPFRLFGGRASLRDGPKMIGEGDAAFDESGALAFEQPALEAGKRFTNSDSAARGHHAVPGNCLTSGTRGHGSASGTSAAGQPRGAGQLAVSDNAAFGDALHQFVDSIPAWVHLRKDNCNGRELPVLPL